MQTVFDNIFLLLVIGIVVPVVFYTIWGLLEIASIPLPGRRAMSIQAPRSGWWKRVNRVEKVWIGIALMWCLILFA